MKIIVHSLHTDRQYEFAGKPEHVFRKLMERFPWLRSGDPEHAHDLDAMIEHLESTQGYEVERVDDDPLTKSEPGNLQGDLEEASTVALDMLGFNPLVHPAFGAARFLSGRPEVGLGDVRKSLHQHEDHVDAALHAYGLDVNDVNRRSLKAVMGMTEQRRASDAPKVPSGASIEPGTPDAATATEAVRRAWTTGQVKVAHLDGKHAKGSLIAKDGVTDHVFLLKPGANGQSTAAGAAEESASQSCREAAFWHIAEDWGIGESIPRTDLVIIDGHGYAAIRMLPFSWKGLDKKTGGNPTIPRAVFGTYRDRGLVHKWAVMDYVLGNPDRHADNIMISEDNKLVALIDHGSAFAGLDFDPARDKNSFVPYYLRAWAGPKFNTLTVKEKLERMPTVGRQLQDELMTWFNGIHADRLEGLLVRFGIDPRPTTARLAKVKLLASQMPLDQAINRLWVTT